MRLCFLAEGRVPTVLDIDEDEEDRVFSVLDSWVKPDDEQISRSLLSDVSIAVANTFRCDRSS